MESYMNVSELMIYLLVALLDAGLISSQKLSGPRTFNFIQGSTPNWSMIDILVHLATKLQHGKWKQWFSSLWQLKWIHEHLLKIWIGVVDVPWQPTELKGEITDLNASMPKFLKRCVITSVVDGFLTIYKLVRSEERKKSTLSAEKENREGNVAANKQANANVVVAKIKLQRRLLTSNDRGQLVILRCIHTVHFEIPPLQ